MLKYLVIGGLLLSASGTAQAGERCNRPYAPVIKIDASTDTAQLKKLKGDVGAFQAASDIYQSCLLRGAATAQIRAQIETNQADKERVARQFNAGLKMTRG